MPSHVFSPQTFAKFDLMNTLIETHLLPPSPSLTSALKLSSLQKLDAIQISPNEGKFLYLLAKISCAKRVLEIGTLGGYSTIWLASALPLKEEGGGKVISLEINEKHAEVARRNIENAGFSHVVEIRVGKALETLKKIKEDEEEGFDMVFIDADKENVRGYLEFALELGKEGTVVVVDNVVRQGKVLGDRDEASEGVRRAMEFLKGEERFEATALQTVGPKGWDGMVIARIVA